MDEHIDNEFEVLRDYETGELYKATKEEVELHEISLSRITPFKQNKIIIISNPN